jgi:hypothetical protein
MLSYQSMIEEMKRLNFVANSLANTISNIRQSMTGRGISPDKSPVIEARLNEVELKLRTLGADLDNPIPFKE